MFERRQDSNNSVALENITFGTLFDDKQLEPNINTELIELSRSSYKEYSISNTRYSAENLLRRPDITVSFKLLKEISKQGIALYYNGLNIPLTLNTNTFEMSAENLRNAPESTIKSIFENIFAPYHISSCVASGDNTGGLCFINAIKGASFLTKLKGIDETKANNERFTYRRLKDLELTLIENRFDNTLVYEVIDNNNLRKMICILTNKHSWKKVRTTVSKVFELYPEILVEDIDENYRNKIKTLFESLGETTNDNTTWQETVLSVLQDESRTNQKQKAALEQLLEYSKQEEINNIKREINRCKDRINNYFNDIEQANTQMRRYEGRLLRMEQDPELKGSIQEAMEYANKSKLISDFRIEPRNKTIQFKVDAPIRYFDPEYAKALFKNLADNGAYKRHNDLKVFKEMFSKLFIEDKYTLYCTTLVQILLYTSEDTPLAYRLEQRGNTSEMTYIGQPHLDGYNCLGNNKIEAKKACNEFDLLGLMTVLTTSAQNFNLTDSAVFGHFKEQIMYYTPSKKTIRDNETGEWYSFDDLYNKASVALFKTTEGKQTKEKYTNTAIEDEDIEHLAKALKALGTLYTTSYLAKAIAIYTRGHDNTVLYGNSGTQSFYSLAQQDNLCVKLEYENKVLKASTCNTDYFTFYDNLLFEGDSRSSNCFTDLLDNLHEETKTNNPDRKIVGTAATAGIPEAEAIAMFGTTGDVPMPF